MKKRKLKKKIKRLRKELEIVVHDGKEAFNNQSGKISNLGDRYIKLREDFNNFKQKSNADGLQFQINDIYEKLKILKLRTETDYTKFSKNEEKTCNTCRWYQLLQQGGQDIPCMGCTDDNKKMWKSKES